MIKVAFEAVSRFLAGLAASLTGLGVLCTAVGFVAERSRLRVLGLSSVPVDLDQYLITGATLIVRLPAAFVVGVTGIREPWLRIGLVVAGVGLVVWLAGRAPSSSRLRGAARWASASGRWLPLVALLAVQLAVIPRFTGLGAVSDLLFETAVGADSPLGTRIRALDREEELADFLGRSLGFFALSLLAVIRLAPGRSRREPPSLEEGEIAGMVVVAPRPPRSAPAGAAVRLLLLANMLLLAVQVYLLPINYGTSVLGYRFALACVALDDAATAPGGGDPSFVVHADPGALLLYTVSDRTLTEVSRGDLRQLTYIGSADIVHAAWRAMPLPTCPASPGGTE